MPPAWHWLVHGPTDGNIHWINKRSVQLSRHPTGSGHRDKAAGRQWTVVSGTSCAESGTCPEPVSFLFPVNQQRIPVRSASVAWERRRVFQRQLVMPLFKSTLGLAIWLSNNKITGGWASTRFTLHRFTQASTSRGDSWWTHLLLSPVWSDRRTFYTFLGHSGQQ